MADIIKKATLHFLGAASTVTGSKIVLETEEFNALIDCGMFQGLKELRVLNWEPLPFDPGRIDVVLLTHGHLDHVGYLPRLIKQGFKGSIIGTAPTLDIAEIILRDSAKIHEEEARKANEEGYSRHHPALPYYTGHDVAQVLKLFRSQDTNHWVRLSESLKCRFVYNGHILGACFIELDLGEKRFVFSGDIGRRNDLLLHDPERPKKADFLILESTYGNKLHPKDNIEEVLADLIKEIIHTRGTLIIPTFAVERLQLVMHILWRMYKKNRIPGLPIYIDSPMGNDVLTLFRKYPGWHKMPLNELKAASHHMRIITSYRDTWNAIDDARAKVVVAGSGMVTGGRVLTYLQQYADQESTLILLVGYQAEGTRGRQLLDGAHEIKIRGRYYPVKARIHYVESLSAHADQGELIDWLGQIAEKPRKVFLVHGESGSVDALRVKLEYDLGWECIIPSLNQKITIDL
jgi:metallo-beta-lactamase family protein